MKSAHLDFGELQDRLIRRLCDHLSSGDLTGRHLARMTGISQPHMHHILKRVRSLTPASADLILRALGLRITDLLEDSELTAERVKRPCPGKNARELFVLSGQIGPGSQWPTATNPFERLSIPAGSVAGFTRPVAARLGADPSMQATVRPGELVVLDSSEPSRSEPDARQLYAVDWHGQSLVRWVRRTSLRLYLASEDTLYRAGAWEAAPVARILDVVRARIARLPELLTPEGEERIPRRPPGTSPAPGRHSAAS